MLIPQIAFLPEKHFLPIMHFRKIRFLPKVHFSQIAIPRLCISREIALWTGEARSGAVTPRSGVAAEASRECWRYYPRRAVGSEVGVFVRGQEGILTNYYDCLS